MPINRRAAWGLLGLFEVYATLTAQEIQGLAENTVTLISNPGPNAYNLLLHISATSIFGTTPFLIPNLSAFTGAQIFYHGPSRLSATASVSDLQDVIVGPQSAVGNFTQAGVGMIPTQAFPLSEVANRSILIGNLASGSGDTPADYIGGDGSLRLSLLYRTINLS